MGLNKGSALFQLYFHFNVYIIHNLCNFFQSILQCVPFSGESFLFNETVIYANEHAERTKYDTFYPKLEFDFLIFNQIYDLHTKKTTLE